MEASIMPIYKIESETNIQLDKRIITELFAHYSHKPFDRFQPFKNYRAATMNRAIKLAKDFDIVCDNKDCSRVIFNGTYDNSMLHKIISGKLKLRPVFRFPVMQNEEEEETPNSSPKNSLSSLASMDEERERLKNELQRLEDIKELGELIKVTITAKECDFLIDLANSIKAEDRAKDHAA